ncbi:RagB/SusD family nutrient uptake outer membrane protein [Dyadobacter jejuensis]|nr:RagB/SusD family nutrient uptake outer membrane protein [Dyadobacter jejuensis]
MIRKLMTAGMAVVMFSACTDDLTLTPISQITNTSFWKSAEEAEGGLNGMYVRLRTQAANNMFVWGEARSEIWAQNFGFDPSANYYAFANDLSQVNAGPDWTTMYSVVHDANLIIKYVPDISFPSESEKNEILAQAYATRAFVYFTMSKVWGDLILITEPTEGIEPDKIYQERATQAEVFALIKEDLERSLSLFDTNEFSEGRIKWSEPAVNALKADVYLWSGKKLGGGAADFTEALEAISEVESSDVELLTDFNDIFSFTNKGNKEVILSVRFAEGESTTRTVYGGVTALASPTAPYTDQSVIDKLLPYSGKNVYWQLSSLVTDQFSDEDSRKDASFIEVTQTRDGVTSLLYNIDQKWPGVISGGVRVMYDDFIVYRYADVVLMKAEAQNALGQDPSEAINLIRKRAYGENYEAHTFVSSTQEENDEVILQERLFEFLQEGKRWYDLVRFDKALQKVPSLEGKTQNDLLFPLSETILSLEPLIEQNPGY